MMKQAEKQEKQGTRLPAWRVITAIVMVTAATVLLICGSVTMTARAAFSKRIVQNVYDKINIWEAYGETATKALNIGIAHLTNTPYEPDNPVTLKKLQDWLDEKTVKDFLIKKTSEHASAIINDKEAKLTSAELAALFKPVQTHVEEIVKLFPEEADRDEAIRSEIRKAIGHDEYITSREKINAEIAKTLNRDPDTFDVLRFLSAGRGIACMIAGVLLLMGVYVAIWPKIKFAGLLCIISCVVLCIALLLVGILVQYTLKIDEDVMLFGKTVLQTWIEEGSALFIRRAFLALLGCIVPIAINIYYTYDKRHVKRIWRQPVRTEK